MSAKETEVKPWERQEKETPKPYEAFCVYRDLGIQRSHQKVADRLGKSTTIIARWSSEYNWVERVAAWDIDQERIAREIADKEMRDSIRKMRKRQAETGRFMQVKALKALNRIPEDEIKPGDIARLVDVGAKLERTARGDVGEVIEERHGEDAIPAVQFYIPDNGRQNNDDEDDV